jgi:hypothetical protein
MDNAMDAGHVAALVPRVAEPEAAGVQESGLATVVIPAIEDLKSSADRILFPSVSDTISSDGQWSMHALLAFYTSNQQDPLVISDDIIDPQTWVLTAWHGGDGESLMLEESRTRSFYTASDEFCPEETVQKHQTCINSNTSLDALMFSDSYAALNELVRISFPPCEILRIDPNQINDRLCLLTKSLESDLGIAALNLNPRPITPLVCNCPSSRQ